MSVLFFVALCYIIPVELCDLSELRWVVLADVQVELFQLMCKLSLDEFQELCLNRLDHLGHANVFVCFVIVWKMARVIFNILKLCKFLRNDVPFSLSNIDIRILGK